MITIRDVSKYDYPQYSRGAIPPDFTQYDAYIIRVFDGVDQDPMFETSVASCEAAGKPWWPYQFYDWFFWAKPQVDKAQAILTGHSYKLTTMYDMEQWDNGDPNGNPYPPRLNLLQGMKDLYDEHTLKTGKLPIWYMNVDAINYLRPIPSWMTDCMLHVADWRNIQVPGFAPWAKWTFRQYQGDPDLSHFNGSDAEFQALINPTPPEPPVGISDHDLLMELVTWAEGKGFTVT